jgi:hypothetical protein
VFCLLNTMTQQWFGYRMQKWAQPQFFPGIYLQGLNYVGNPSHVYKAEALQVRAVLAILTLCGCRSQSRISNDCEKSSSVIAWPSNCELLYNHLRNNRADGTGRHPRVQPCPPGTSSHGTPRRDICRAMGCFLQWPPQHSYALSTYAACTTGMTRLVSSSCCTRDGLLHIGKQALQQCVDILDTPGCSTHRANIDPLPASSVWLAYSVQSRKAHVTVGNLQTTEKGFFIKVQNILTIH